MSDCAKTKMLEHVRARGNVERSELSDEFVDVNDVLDELIASREPVCRECNVPEIADDCCVDIISIDN
jgi:hypothetical protein